jgi:hypothetical protein
MTNYHPEYVPTISTMTSPMQYIEDYLRQEFFATELYTAEMMANEKKNPQDCVQYVYNKAFEIASKARQGKVGVACGSDALFLSWAKYYYENDVEVKPMPKNVAAVSAAPSMPKPSADKPKDEKKAPTKEQIKKDAQAKAKEDVDNAKADATKIAKAAQDEGKKAGYIDPDYQHGEDEDKPQAPIIDIKLPPKGNAPKVSSQFKRGSKEYKEALAKQSEEQDLFADLFNEE